MTIENIVFDFGGVLVDWNPRYMYNKLFDDDQQMEHFLTHICTNSWNMQQDAGRPLAEATKLLIKQFPQHASLIKRYYDDWEEMLKGDIPENSRVIKPLKDKNYRLFGLTNWSGETFPIAYAKYEFFSEFEGIVVSGDVKMIKPDKDIYLLLLERYQIKSENSLFIDDNLNNIKTAIDLGFHTIHLHDNLNLEQELKQLEIL